jgi:hypothetical protein
METGFDTYMNSGYKSDRIDKKTMLVRWEPKAANETKINLDLVEPFRVDVQSDIYLDNFTTFVVKAPTASAAKAAFVLRINEFNIQSNVAGNASGVTLSENRGHMFNNIVIPADSFTDRVSSHKSKKMNYICSINPTTITKITGTVTDLDGSSMFENASDSFVAEFVFAARK